MTDEEHLIQLPQIVRIEFMDFFNEDPMKVYHLSDGKIVVELDDARNHFYEILFFLQHAKLR
jgi:hypothetical protein